MENTEKKSLKNEIEQVSGSTPNTTEVQDTDRVKSIRKPIKGKYKSTYRDNKSRFESNEEYFEVARLYPMPPYEKKSNPDMHDALWVVDIRKEKAYLAKPNFKSGKMTYSVNNQRYSLDYKDLKQTGPNCWRIELSYNS